MVTCAVLHCKNRHRSGHVLCVLPRDEHMSQQWKDAIDKHGKVDWAACKGYRVCEVHFKRDDWIKYRSSLKKDAVPSIFPGPAPPKPKKTPPSSVPLPHEDHVYTKVKDHVYVKVICSDPITQCEVQLGSECPQDADTGATPSPCASNIAPAPAPNTSTTPSSSVTPVPVQRVFTPAIIPTPSSAAGTPSTLRQRVLKPAPSRTPVTPAVPAAGLDSLGDLPPKSILVYRGRKFLCMELP